MYGSCVGGCLINAFNQKALTENVYFVIIICPCCQGSFNVLWAKHCLKCLPPCQEIVEFLKRHWVLSSAPMALPFAFVGWSANRLLWFRPRNVATAIRHTFIKFLRDVQGPQRGGCDMQQRTSGWNLTKVGCVYGMRSNHSTTCAHEC